MFKKVLCVCFTLVLASSVFGAETVGRVALVIGNAAYKSSPLANPVNDATDMAKSLRALGFNVVLSTNITSKQIGRTLRAFRTKIKPGDVALVFYAGHGLQINGENYLPAVDADIVGEEDVPNQSLSTRQIMDVLADSKSSMNLVFLDACRDNPYARSFRSATRGLSRENAPSGTLISYATRPGSVAADGTGRNGLYTSVLLKAMEEKNQPIEQVLKQVVRGVTVASNGAQEPWMEGSVTGDFCFGSCSRLSESNAPRQESDAETTLWTMVSSGKELEGVRLYLARYPNGKFSEVAKVLLKEEEDRLAAKALAEKRERERALLAAEKKASVKVAFAYVGPVGTHGWTYAHELGRRAVQQKFGDKIVTSYVENVPENADGERVIRALASQGNTLIFGTTFGYMEPILKIAGDFPTRKFEHITGYKTAQNVRTYDSRNYESAYMAGVVAGSVTESNVLGFVGSIPIPEVIRNINSFTLGAQSVNSAVTTKVVWVGEWFNPPKETEAAQSLINAGADVLMQNTDSSAVLQTAEKNGKRAFGWDTDMSAFAPKAHLGSAVLNFAPYYIQSVQDLLNGTWKTSAKWWGVKEGAVDLVSLAPDLPSLIKKNVASIKSGLQSGSLKIWAGPLFDNIGRLQIARGMNADDRFLAGMKFYVKGVEGRVPGT